MAEDGTRPGGRKRYKRARLGRSDGSPTDPQTPFDPPQHYNKYLEALSTWKKDTPIPLR